MIDINLTKTTAAQNEVALSYRSVRGLNFLAVVYMRSILYLVLTATVYHFIWVQSES